VTVIYNTGIFTPEEDWTTKRYWNLPVEPGRLKSGVDSASEGNKFAEVVRGVYDADKKILSRRRSEIRSKCWEIILTDLRNRRDLKTESIRLLKRWLVTVVWLMERV